MNFTLYNIIIIAVIGIYPLYLTIDLNKEVV